MATLVQIKRSNSNTSPSSLLAGELAYSYLSNTLFIGNSANVAMNIGGKFYTDLIDAASAANGASTFVRRYANGSVQFSQLDILTTPTADSHVATKSYVDAATANAATSLDKLTDVTVVGNNAAQNNRILIGHANGQYITTDVSGNVSLSNTGVFTVGADQITNAMLVNDAVTITAGTGLVGGGSVALGSTITLDVAAGDGIANSGDVIAVDSTVVRTTGTQTIQGNKTFSNTITFSSGINVTGNINLSGNTTYVNVSTLNISDPLIYLAANNDTSDIVDIGFMGGKNTSGTYSHTGLIRHAQDGTWYLFDGLVDEGHENNIVDVANTYYALLRANLEAKKLLVTGTGSTANIDTTLEVTGNTTLKSNLSVSKNVSVTQNLSVTGDFTVNTDKFRVFAGNGNAILDGDLQINGGDIISTATANVVNVTTTTLNLGGAATTIRVGAATGNTTIRHSLDVSKNVAVSENLSVAETSKSNTFVSTKTALSAPSLSNFNGERLRLFDFDQAGRPNYAIGVEGSHIWMGVDSSANTEGFKWYGNTALAARLSANGVLQVANSVITDQIFAGNVNVTSTLSTANLVVTQNANITGTLNVTSATWLSSLSLGSALPTNSGGTGVTSFTANGVWYSDTTSTLSFATGTEGNVLQISSGVPTFAMLDGGSF